VPWNERSERKGLPSCVGNIPAVKNFYLPWNEERVKGGISATATREGRGFCRESWPAKLAPSLAPDSPILWRFLASRWLQTVFPYWPLSPDSYLRNWPLITSYFGLDLSSSALLACFPTLILDRPCIFYCDPCIHFWYLLFYTCTSVFRLMATWLSTGRIFRFYIHFHTCNSIRLLNHASGSTRAIHPPSTLSRNSSFIYCLVTVVTACQIYKLSQMHLLYSYGQSQCDCTNFYISTYRLVFLSIFYR
jgi:hypothetical protein